MTTPRSIVIVKLSAIGDVLHGVPVAVALRRAFPEARIGWVVEGAAADVLAGHPAIDHCFRVRRRWLQSAGAVLDLRRQLCGFNADVGIDLQGLFKSAVATWLTGARLRIGFAPPVAREQSWRGSTRTVLPRAAHVVDRNCELLGPLGISVPAPAFEMPRWPVSRLRMEEYVASLRLSAAPVIVNPGAGWASKRWPPERFAAVARELRRRRNETTVVVWGGAAEQEAAARIVGDSGGAAIMGPPTTLQDLGELCRLSRLVISGDTGPLHLAAAVAAPCVGLFGPVPAERNGPYGRQHVCVEPPPAVRPPWEARKTDSRAMGCIEVADVVAAAESVLARSRAA
jgi:heptosyltransferase-1